MNSFLIGAIIGLIIGFIVGCYGAKIVDTPETVTNINGGKQVIKDSPGASIELKPEKEQYKPIKNFFKNLKFRKNEKN